uniref:Uncharacterized protein n=1 Tax=viral metagenome TaxID=1070528 RepID=A0A6C0BQN2_9ZZZZ
MPCNWSPGCNVTTTLQEACRLANCSRYIGFDSSLDCTQSCFNPTDSYVVCPLTEAIYCYSPSVSTGDAIIFEVLICIGVFCFIAILWSYACCPPPKKRRQTTGV